MASIAQTTRNHITLKGSTEIVTEFFGAIFFLCHFLFSFEAAQGHTEKGESTHSPTRCLVYAF
jgi:hypothetical protein